jgi:hypothetical protein
MAHTPRLGFAIGIAVVTYLGGCDGRTALMVPGAGPGSTNPGAAMGGGTVPGAPAGPGVGAPGSGRPGQPGPGNGAGRGGPGAASGVCRSNPSQCADGRDNDGDGKVDADDPECSGACDDDEGSFATGIPGDNRDDERSCHQDCFFDGNSGHGDDGCRFDLRCDPARAGAAICPYTPDRPGLRCADQANACVNRCRQATPNGCDCFGCCAVPGLGFAVRLSATCTAATLGDPARCARCTQVTSCLNPCDPCEVCIGRPRPDPSCAPPPPPPMMPPPAGGNPNPPPPGGACESGQVSCGPGAQVAANGCAAGTYCVTGCCRPVVID